MQIKYDLTLEDDLNASQTSWEYFFYQGNIIFLPTRYFAPTISIVFIIWGILTENPDDADLLIPSGIFLLILGLLLWWFYQPKNMLTINRSQITKAWNNGNRQSDYRLISITPDNFSFKATNSELIWQWQALKDFYEGSQGFEMVFYSGHRRCISKRIFKDDVEMNVFKKLIAEYRKQEIECFKDATRNKL